MFLISPRYIYHILPIHYRLSLDPTERVFGLVSSRLRDPVYRFPRLVALAPFRSVEAPPVSFLSGLDLLCAIACAAPRLPEPSRLTGARLL